MKKYWIIFIFLLFLIFVLVSFMQKQKCYSVSQTLVSWNSMSGVLQDWEKISVFEWFYNCHNVERWDIIIYQTLSRWQLVKEVKVLPWDQLKADFEKGFLQVNGKILSNYLWENYIFRAEELKFMELFFQDGYMQKDNYFIFWTSIFGWFDSRKIWGINREYILWKVFLNN